MKSLIAIFFIALSLTTQTWAQPTLENSNYCYYAGSIQGHREPNVRGELSKSGDEYLAFQHGYRFQANPSQGALVITSPSGEISGAVEAWETRKYKGLKTSLETENASLNLVCY